VTVQTALPPNAPKATEAEEENIKLQPLNAFDKPSVHQSLVQITTALSESSDPATWDNLIPFLEGVRLARVKLDTMFLTRLARKANLQGKGRWNTILTAATMAKRTDVRLDQRGLTRELILGAHHRAAVSHFSSDGPAKTVERVVLLLEADEHCGQHHLDTMSKLKNTDIILHKSQRAEIEACTDMRRDPFVIAAKLSFASAKALRDHKGKDTDGLVAKTTQQLIAIVKGLDSGLIKFTQKWNSTSGRAESETRSDWARDANVLEELSVVQCALTLANKVDMQPTLEKEKNVQLHSALRKVLDQVQREISSAKSSVRKASGDRPRRCFQLLDAVQETLKKL